MKKLLLISLLIGAMPLGMMAQDDDLYFVPKKNKAASKIEVVTEDTQYEGLNRTVDDYNRRTASTYEVIDGDTTKLDIIEFSEGKGVYPDSLKEDYELTKKMQRFDDYDISDNAAFWAGYNAGRYDWGWHSPWYYRTYGWYDPWYYGSWYSSYYPWYDPWYYPYGYYGYYGWGWPYHYGYYGWGYHYYYGYPYYYVIGGGGSGHYYGRTGNAGTIDRRGSSSYRRYNSVAGNASRTSSLRDRAASMGGGRVYRSGNSQTSRSGNFSGRRGNSSTYSPSSSSSRSSSSWSGSRSSGGGFSGGSHSSGGSRSSGGGGSRMGGRR